MSPPCQDFSTAGARDHTNPRTFLYERGLQFLEGINEINEHLFIEEVPAFFTAKLSKEIPILTILKEKLYELGYKITFALSGFRICSVHRTFAEH